jgi:hypothetical protein
VIKFDQIEVNQRMTGPKKPDRSEQAVRSALPEELRPHFDQLVQETRDWSSFFYGAKFVSYQIIGKLIEDGWRKVE